MIAISRFHPRPTTITPRPNPSQKKNRAALAANGPETEASFTATPDAPLIVRVVLHRAGQLDLQLRHGLPSGRHLRLFLLALLQRGVEEEDLVSGGGK